MKKCKDCKYYMKGYRQIKEKCNVSKVKKDFNIPHYISLCNEVFDSWEKGLICHYYGK